MKKTRIKTNYTRAMKNLMKAEKVNRLYYQQITEDNMLVSDGHAIITVPVIDFLFFKKSFEAMENESLLNLLKGAQSYTATATYTSLLIDTREQGGRLTRVYKSNYGHLIPIQEKYLDIVRDTAHAEFIYILLANNERSPLFYVDTDGENNVIGGFAILPVNTNVTECLERILQ